MVNVENLLAYTAPPTITALASVIVALVSHRKVTSIDQAVNGTKAGEPTIRESVEQINAAVNGAAENEPSIRQNVEALTDRRDLDPRINN